MPRDSLKKNKDNELEKAHQNKQYSGCCLAHRIPLQEGRPYSSRLWLPSSLLKLLGSSEQKREASSRTTTASPGSQWQVTPQWAVLRARLSRLSWASQNCHAIFSLAAASVENTSQCNFFVQFCILSFHKCWFQEPSLIKVSSLVFRGTHPT